VTGSFLIDRVFEALIGKTLSRIERQTSHKGMMSLPTVCTLGRLQSQTQEELGALSSSAEGATIGRGVQGRAMRIMSLRDGDLPSKQSPVSRGDCFATCARNDMQTASLRELQSASGEELSVAATVRAGSGVQRWTM